MVKFLFLIALGVATLQATPPADYYQSTTGLSGDQLRQALHQIVKNHQVLEYGETRMAIATLHEDPNNNKNLIQVYTQKSVPKKDHNSWNREHLWPRARGNTDKRGPDDTDLHHLFPSEYRVNADRASLLFDKTSPPRLPERWSKDENSFQPPAKVTGDIARALFYMAIRYDGSDPHTSNLTLTSQDAKGSEMGHLMILLQWHREDPPDAFERRRNDLIFKKFQKNRNPFVDHPEFALLIWKEVERVETFSPSEKADSVK